MKSTHPKFAGTWCYPAHLKIHSHVLAVHFGMHNWFKAPEIVISRGLATT